MDNIVKLLQSVGVEDADKLIQGDFDVNEVAQRIAQSHRLRFENDPEFVTRYKQSGASEIVNELQSSLQEIFGVSKDELANKSLKDAIVFAKTKTLENVSTSQKEIEQKIIEANRQRIEKENELKMLQLQHLEQIKQLKMDSELNRIISQFDTVLQNKNVVKAALYDIMKRNSNKYRFDFDDETQSVIVKTRDGYQVMNESATRVLSTDEVIKKLLSDEGLIKTNNTNQSPVTTQVMTSVTSNSVNTGRVNIDNHQKDIQIRLAEMQNRMQRR